MDSYNAQPPSLGPGRPTYPHLLQMVRVTAATVPGPAGTSQPAGSSVPGPSLYVAFTQQMRSDGTLLPRDREPCLADDVNGTGLTAGYYLGRLAGAFNSLPVYEVIGAASGGSVNPNSPVTFNNTVTFNGAVTINNVENFGTTPSASSSPPGTLSKPTQTVTGAPTWIPATSNYPLLWGAYDHIEWEYDGLIRTPGGSSAILGDTGWVPFVSVGRTAVADANYTAITIDRTIAYTSISSARVVTLPRANSLPPGFVLTVQDESGSASATNTVSVARSGSDQINRAAANVVVVNTAFGAGTAETDGVSNWTVRQYASSSASVSGYEAHQGNPPNTGSQTISTGYTNIVTKVVPVGTYEIWGFIACELSGVSLFAGDGIQVQIKDLGAGVIVGNTTDFQLMTAPVAASASYNAVTMVVNYTTLGSTTIAIQAKTTSMGGSANYQMANLFIMPATIL